ncbi:hypothetical protein D3C73_1459740 [compost metagenome]
MQLLCTGTKIRRYFFKHLCILPIDQKNTASERYLHENEKDVQAEYESNMRFKMSQKFKMNCRQQKNKMKERF